MTRHRAAITFLAVVLAVETMGAAVAMAADGGPNPVAPGTAAPDATAAAAARLAGASAGAVTVGRWFATAGLAATFGPDVPGDDRIAQVVVPTPPPPPAAKPAAVKAAAVKPAGSQPAAGSAKYAGRNHLWVPAFGINRPVYGFSCSRAQRPGSVVYRWGCAGRNNTYLFGHAANVFSGLYRAYLNKKIKVGQAAWYADSKGNVSKYVVKWWKLVRPDVSPDGIWGPLARPSLTLQTCVGAKSEWRLIVRLEKVSG